MTTATAGAVEDSAAAVRSAARGWHTVQLAALGFIGLCGVLQTGPSPAPHWLAVLAAGLVVAALVVACAAVALVAREAWPLPARRSPRTEGWDDATTVGRGATRLRLGIGLTFAAVALTAVAASSTWWPAAAPEVVVTLSTPQGSICGSLAGSQDGSLTLDVDGQQVVVPLDRLTSLDVGRHCP